MLLVLSAHSFAGEGSAFDSMVGTRFGSEDVMVECAKRIGVCV
jgi:hypothetical protein